MTEEQMEGQIGMFGPDTSFGRMSLGPCPVPEKTTPEKTSKQSSRKSSASSAKKLPTFQYLAVGGVNRDASWVSETVDASFPSLIEYTMPSFGESPSEENASRLSQFLVECPHPKYYLSEKACEGILRRAEKRGKELPAELKMALEAQANVSTLGMSSQSISSQQTESLNHSIAGSADMVEEKVMSCPITPPVTPSKLGGGREIDSLGKRAGKGALIQTEKSGTLGVSQDQTLIQVDPHVFSIEGNGTRESHHGDGFSEADEPSFTLNTVERHAVAYTEPLPFDTTQVTSPLNYSHPRYGDPCHPLTSGGNPPSIVDSPKAYAFDALESNAMRSSNPHSGCRQVEVSKTLDCTDPNPSKNQGGIAILETDKE